MIIPKGKVPPSDWTSNTHIPERQLHYIQWGELFEMYQCTLYSFRQNKCSVFRLANQRQKQQEKAYTWKMEGKAMSVYW